MQLVPRPHRLAGGPWGASIEVGLPAPAGDEPLDGLGVAERSALIAGLLAGLDEPDEGAILNIGAPFWGLVFGFAASWLLERGDFRGRASS